MTPAPGAGHTSPPIPPARYWPLSPTYNHWVKLSAHDIAYTLHQPPAFAGQNVLFFGNSPVRYAYVVGLVLSVDLPSDATAVILLDDGSGVCLEAVLREGVAVDGLVRDSAGVSLSGRTLVPGTVIKAKGTFSSFRGVRQLELRRAAVVGCTRDEVAAWQARVATRKELERGWTLSEAERKAMDVELAKAAAADKLAAARDGLRKVKREEHERKREERRERRRLKEERELDTGALI